MRSAKQMTSIRFCSCRGCGYRIARATERCDLNPVSSATCTSGVRVFAIRSCACAMRRRSTWSYERTPVATLTAPRNTCPDIGLDLLSSFATARANLRLHLSSCFGRVCRLRDHHASVAVADQSDRSRRVRNRSGRGCHVDSNDVSGSCTTLPPKPSRKWISKTGLEPEPPPELRGSAPNS
jgi:hypothetical protein